MCFYFIMDFNSVTLNDFLVMVGEQYVDEVTVRILKHFYRELVRLTECPSFVVEEDSDRTDAFAMVVQFLPKNSDGHTWVSGGYIGVISRLSRVNPRADGEFYDDEDDCGR